MEVFEFWVGTVSTTLLMLAFLVWTIFRIVRGRRDGL